MTAVTEPSTIAASGRTTPRTGVIGHGAGAVHVDACSAEPRADLVAGLDTARACLR